MNSRSLRLGNLEKSLKYAMQMAATAEESAATLLLETDPSTRMPRKFYEIWYQKLALRETEQALKNVEKLQEELGNEWESTVSEYGGRFSVLCAEARLQHDTLYETIRQNEEKLSNDEVDCEE